jgi:hypothetical protein
VHWKLRETYNGDALPSQKEAVMNLLDKEQRLTKYAFSCGYVERHMELCLSLEHGVYFVKGFAGEFHVMHSFRTLGEARKFMYKRAKEKVVGFE